MQSGHNLLSQGDQIRQIVLYVQWISLNQTPNFQVVATLLQPCEKVTTT